MTIHGSWKPDRQPPKTGGQSFCEAIRKLSSPVYVVDLGGRIGVAQDGIATLKQDARGHKDTHPLLGWSPPEMSQSDQVHPFFSAGKTRWRDKQWTSKRQQT